VIDRARLLAQGALLLTKRGDGFAVTPARGGGTDRPWWPAPSETAEFDPTLSPRAPAARIHDATPPDAEQGAED
jgi:competence protein ComEC